MHENKKEDFGEGFIEKMDRYQKYMWYLSGGLILAVLIYFLGFYALKNAGADNIGSQPVKTSVILTSPSTDYLNLGTGLTGTLQSITMSLDSSVSNSVDVGIFCFNTASYNTACSGLPWSGGSYISFTPVSVIGGQQDVTFTMPSTIVFDPSKYYNIAIFSGSGPISGTVHFYGDSGLASGFQAYYFLNNTAPATTKILSFLPNSTVATTSPVTLSGTYYTGSDLGSSNPNIILSLQNNDVNLTGTDALRYVLDLGPMNQNVGLHSFATTTALRIGFYAGSAFLRGTDLLASGATNYVASLASNFVVGSTSFPVAVLGDYFPNETSTSTLKAQLAECDALSFPANVACYFGTVSKNIISYLFVPNPQAVADFKSLTVRNSLPFAYAYDAPVLMNDLLNSPSTSTDELAISLPGWGAGGATSSGANFLKLVHCRFITTPQIYFGGGFVSEISAEPINLYSVSTRLIILRARPSIMSKSCVFA